MTHVSVPLPVELVSRGIVIMGIVSGAVVLADLMSGPAATVWQVLGVIMYLAITAMGLYAWKLMGENFG